MENNFKTKGILIMIFKWKWHLLILTIIGCTLGIIFSSPYFIKPMYKSTAVIYPVNLKQISKESESEQLLEIIQSTDIKFQVIDALNLYKHYKVDKENDPQHITNVLTNFNKNVSFKKTPNEAIQITVLDEVPQMASDIIDSILYSCNRLTLKIHTDQSKEFVEIYQNVKNRKMAEIDSLKDCLTKYRTEYGLLDMNEQVKKCTEAINEGKNVNEAKTILDNWKKYGADYITTDSLYVMALGYLNFTSTIYENNRREAEKYQTYYKLVTKQFPADKKATPVRWIIVLLSTIGAFFAGIIFIATIEGIKTQKN